MLVLDTHVWIWWTHGDARLTAAQANAIRSNEAGGLGVSAISCWEVAKLAELGRIGLPLPVREWLRQALDYPGVQLVELTSEVAAESASLPGEFHRDPADQIIVATARVLGCPLVTSDERIIAYPHVEAIR